LNHASGSSASSTVAACGDWFTGVEDACEAGEDESLFAAAAWDDDEPAVSPKLQDGGTVRMLSALMAEDEDAAAPASDAGTAGVAGTCR